MGFEPGVFIDAFDEREKKLTVLREAFVKVAGNPAFHEAYDYSLELWKSPDNAALWWITPTYMPQGSECRTTPLEHLAGDPDSRLNDIIKKLDYILHAPAA